MLTGLEYQTKQVFEWLQEFQYQKKRAFILRGAPGVGKTALVYDIASEHNYNVIEFNASDERRKDFLLRLKSLSKQQSLDGKSTIILLDEADGFGSKKGLGGVISKTYIPIVLTCNDISKLQPFRKFCRELYIPKPSYSDVNFKIKDHRQANLMERGSQGYIASQSQKNKIFEMTRSGDYSDIDERDVVILLDSAPVELFGWELFRFVKGLQCFDYCKRSECLSGLTAKINKVHSVWLGKKHRAHHDGE